MRYLSGKLRAPLHPIPISWYLLPGNATPRARMERWLRAVYHGASSLNRLALLLAEAFPSEPFSCQAVSLPSSPSFRLIIHWSTGVRRKTAKLTGKECLPSFPFLSGSWTSSCLDGQGRKPTAISHPMPLLRTRLTRHPLPFSTIIHFLS